VEEGKSTISVSLRFCDADDLMGGMLMGMDVFGIDPAGDAGHYFRASIWQWRPLWERMKELCSDFLSTELLAAMAFNDGAGPHDQSTCTKIADRLEQWLHAESRAEYRLEETASALRITSDGTLVNCEELKADAAGLSRSPYSVRRDEITEFIEFLRNCGGFSVW
jgi:hypothetical protein